MNYINLHTDTLRSEQYLGAEPIERATWLNLMAWCATQENGGIIKSASEWADRKWLQLCGITKEEATLVSSLYRMNGEGDLIVSLYPIEKETEVKTKRQIAKTNGSKGGRPKKQPTENQPKTNVGYNEKPTSQSVKGKEGKEKGKRKESEVEGNANDSSAADPWDNQLKRIEKIRSSYPKQSHTRETLEAINGAVKRLATRESIPEEQAAHRIEAGTVAIAEKLMTWPLGERQQFAPTPPNFFLGDRWADDPVEWESRVNPPKPEEELELKNCALGGRKAKRETDLTK